MSFWNVEQDAVAVQPISMSGIARAVRYSPDGTALAIGSDSGQVMLYDPRTLIRLSAPFQHPHFINDLAFAGEETRLTGCWDSTVRQFKLVASGGVEQALAAIFRRGPLPATVLSTIEVEADAGDPEFAAQLKTWKESRRASGRKP